MDIYSRSFITSPNPTNGLVEVKFENNKNQFVLKLIGKKVLF